MTSVIPDDHYICLQWQLDGVFPESAGSWCRLQEDMIVSGAGRRIGMFWAKYCVEAGLNVDPLNRCEGGVCVGEERQIRLICLNRNTYDDELVRYPHGVPMITAYVDRGDWTMKELMIVKSAFKRFIVEDVTGGANIKTRIILTTLEDGVRGLGA